MELIHSKSAGIDIGSEELYVSIGDGEVSKFGTFTQDIEELRDYLISNSIVTVAMEATGIYWINLYEVLAEAGIDVWLVDGKETKEIPFDLHDADIKAKYIDVKGWGEYKSGASYNDMPENFKSYIDYLSSELGVNIPLVSIGPERNELLEL